MTSDNIAFTLILFFKCAAAITALVCAYHILVAGKAGWGWFLFIAYCISPGSIKID